VVIIIYLIPTTTTTTDYDTVISQIKKNLIIHIIHFGEKSRLSPENDVVLQQQQQIRGEIIFPLTMFLLKRKEHPEVDRLIWLTPAVAVVPANKIGEGNGFLSTFDDREGN
jgi:hypothetical protein